MGLRRIIVLLIAVIAAGGTAMYARSWIEGQQTTIAAVAAPAPEEKHEVLIANLDLAAGTFVKPQHLRWQQWPTDDVPASYVLRGVRTMEEMVGAVVRSRIANGEPVSDGAVVKPGDRGFLAAVLNPGMRAVSVPITPTSANSGLIFPGDRIDLILTQTLLPSEGEGGARRVSETVLKNIRIIAMGVETGDDAEAGKNNERAKTATFEVTPGQAEMVALLTELGKLSLSLRSLAADGEADGVAPIAEAESFTWDRDVSRVLRIGRISSRLLVLRGSNTEDVQVQQGSK
jgi:pilus assembly protein CpaB